MTDHTRHGSYQRPGARRRSRIRINRLILYVVILVLLIGGIWTLVSFVKNQRAEKAAQELAQAQLLQEEEEARLAAEAQAQMQAELQASVSAYDEVFADNIYLDGELIAGRSYQDVLSDFNARYQAKLERTVTIRFNGAEWSLSAAMVGGSADVQAQVDQAWSYGHEGTTEEKNDDLQKLRQEPVYLTVSLTYDQAALAAYAQQLKQSVDAQPVDATMEIVGAGETKITDAVLGYELDLAETERLLADALMSADTQSVDLVPQVLEPEVMEDELGGGYVKLAQFSTFFKGSTDNRTYNIKLALDNFHGMVVQPGQKVSFNDVVGPRTAKRGYREAVEYQDGQSVTGVGGGVCQASTTLYGALLRAGLEINARTAHSLPVKYVPPSQDATVSNQGTDLVFTNNTTGPLYIYTSVNKNKSRATVTIYGTPIKSYVEIEIESEIIQGDIAATPKYIKDTEGNHVWYADEVPVLKKAGKLGYKSCAYRIHRHKESGDILKKELLSTDYYAPVAAEYYIGVH